MWRHTVGAGGVVAALVSSAAGRPVLEVGRPFPGLVLPAMADGRPVSIADFRGRKVVLHVFASW